MPLRGLQVRAVLLDALGTLVELQPPAPRLQAELRARLGLEVTLAQAERAMAAEIAYYRSHLDQGCDERSLAELRRRCAEVASAELTRMLGQSLPGGEVMTEVLLSSLHFTAFSDVPEALRRLHALGLRLVVVSNWDVSLPSVLARLGLSQWLDGVVTSAEARSRKPDPGVFQRALHLAEVSAEQAVHVGDSPREDVEGALAAGITPVLMKRSAGPGSASPPPGPGSGSVPVIRSLLELPGLVSAGYG